ncbi:MAG: discoidin domain-containing protein [Candidatus Omnitrophota bacterium]|jgi:hypothetical protein
MKFILLLAALLCFFPSIGFSSEIKITASSSEAALSPENLLDGNMATRWSSKFSDNEWLEIDLGEAKEISGLTLFWETAYASSYEILLSSDGKEWRRAYKQDKAAGGNEEVSFEKTAARYIKLVFKKRTTKWGYSLFEISIFGPGIDNSGKINEGEIIPLEGKWDFKTDPRNIGIKDKWFTSAGAPGDWAQIETGRFWEDQGFPGYDGYAWYKKDILIPANWNDGKAVLMAGGVDDAYELYVNGQFAAGYGPRVTNSRIPGSVNQTLTVSTVGKYLAPGKPNNFTFRVFDDWGGGGISKPPIVLVQDEDVVPQIKKRLDAQSYYQMKARPSERKYYPVWIGGRQAYWTAIGVEGDKAESCFCEDGQLQLYNWGPSLMPFIYLDKKLLTRDDFRISQSLEKNYLPMPTVTWENDDLVFSQRSFGYGKPEESFTCVRYTLKNNSKRVLAGKLFLTIRPFQVYPSWQWSGGMAMIRSLEYDTKGRHTVRIDGKDRLISLRAPDKFGGSTYMEDGLVDALKAGTIAARPSIKDPFDYASGVLEYDFRIKPKGEKEYFFIIPLHGAEAALKVLNGKGPEKDFEVMQVKTREFWEEKLNRVQVNIPDKEMSDAVKTSLAYMFINKNGPMLQAGSGAYKKSWIRDACSASAAMMRMGHTEEVKEYIDWFTGCIKADGKVPPIMISETAAEPAWEREFEEYDSQGQYVYSVLDYYRFTGDKEWLKGKLPAVKRVLDFTEALRKKETSGIFPRSVSHEGYFPAPGVHSYWDDFWGIKGWKDAASIADILGDKELADRAEKEAEDFRRCVNDSIKAVQASKKIDFIPGSLERADLDAPSTAIAVWPTEESKYLPQPSLDNTFGIFWTKQYLPRLASWPKWSYSPYAFRIAQVFVLSDQRDKAVKMLEEFMSMRRPLAWNQWAEGILADDRRPWFVGDLPHTWVASIFINAFRSLFVYEEDGRLILGHGIPEKWLSDKEGVSIGNFPTYYGNLSYSVKEENGVLQIKVSGSAAPPKGFVFKLPRKEGITGVTVNGVSHPEFSGGEVIF